MVAGEFFTFNPAIGGFVPLCLFYSHCCNSLLIAPSAHICVIFVLISAVLIKPLISSSSSVLIVHKDILDQFFPQLYYRFVHHLSYPWLISFIGLPSVL